MGTVKYSGPVASFHCPTEATIRSLKVHFSPKQEGSGDPSPENVREIEGWDEVTVHNDTDGIIVHEEYQKVEYLKNDSGKPYINTNIIPTSNMRIYIEGKTSSNVSAPGFIFGSRNDSGSTINSEMFWAITWNNYYCYGLGTARNTKVISANINENFTLDFNCNYAHAVKFNNVLSVNNDVNTLYSQPIYIFGINTGGTLDSQYVNGLIIKRFIVYEAYNTDTIKANLIPCCRKSDNKPGMYDTVSGEFFTNQGTGEFICGPDVGETTDYEFGVLGKNKFDYTNANIIDAKRRDDNGNEVADGSGSYSSALTQVSPSTTYTASGFGTNLSKRVYYIDADENFLSRSDIISNNTFTFTTPSNCRYVQFQSGRVDNSTWSEVQLELGSTATTYEPYNPNKTVYGGWVDLITGEVCETYTKYIFTGEENFHIENSYMQKPFVWSFDSRFATDTAFASSTDTNLACNKLKAVSGRFHYLNDGCICTATSSVYSYVLINGKDIFGETNEECHQTIANWYSNGTPLVIIAPLRSEYYRTYQLSSIVLQTFLSHNNIWSNADYVEVEYDLHETQNILARKQFIMANQPHIESASGTIASFETDLVAPLKKCKVGFKPVQDLHGYSKPWVGGAGKNLFNENNMTYSLWTSGNGTTDNLASYGCIANDKIFIAADTTLYLTTFGNELYSKAMIFYNTDGTFNSRVYSTGTAQLTYTPAIDCYVTVELACGTSTSTSITEEYVKAAKIVLSVNSAATAYEPWENVCPISGWTGLDVYTAGENLIPIDYEAVEGKWKPTDGIISGSVYNMGQFPVPPALIQYQAETKGITYFGFMDGAIQSGEPTYDVVTMSNRLSYSFDNSDGHKYALITANRESVDSHKVIISVGHSAKNYSEPSGTTLPIDWTTEAGTVYGGYVDLETGEVWKEWYLYRLPRLTTSNCTIGSQYYIKSDAVDLFVYPAADFRQYPSGGAESITYSPMCNRLGFRPKNVWSGVGYPNCWTLNGGQVHFNISNDLLGITDYTQESTTTAKAKVIEYMNSMYDAGNYFEFVYKIRPTLVTTLTPTQLKTLRGTNNIWSSTNGNIELSYWKH